MRPDFARMGFKWIGTGPGLFGAWGDHESHPDQAWLLAGVPRLRGHSRVPQRGNR